MKENLQGPNLDLTWVSSAEVNDYNLGFELKWMCYESDCNTKRKLKNKNGVISLDPAESGTCTGRDSINECK